MIRERPAAPTIDRVAARATRLLAPVVLGLVALWVLRDLWPPFRSVLVLFFLGWLVAFLLDPLVSRTTRRFPRLSRGLATGLVFASVAIVLALLVIALGGSVASSLTDLAGRRAEVASDLTAALRPLEGWAASLGVDLDTEAFVADLEEAIASGAGDAAGAALPAVAGLLGDTLMVLFIGTVMVANKAGVLLFVRRLVAPERLGLFDRFSAEVVRSFGGFIRGQFGLAALYGATVTVVALMLGIPFAPVIGLATLLLQTIPWFGQLVSWVPLVLATLAFRPDVLLPVLVVMLIGWLALQNLVAPRVLGSAVGLHPLAVLAAVLIGGALAGPLGAVFGVPVAAAIAAVFLAWLDVIRPARSVPEPRHRPARRPRGHPSRRPVSAGRG
jgi:predicted PurR-regulated permease PerM